MNDRDDVSLSDSIHQILNKMGPLVSLYENNDKQYSLSSLQYRYLGLCFSYVPSPYLPKQLFRIAEAVSLIGKDLKVILFPFIVAKRPIINSSLQPFLGFKFSSPHIEHWFAKQLQIKLMPSIYIYDRTGKLVSKKGIHDITQYRERVLDYWDQLQIND